MNLPDLQNEDQHFSSYKKDFSPNVEAGLKRLHGRIETGVGSQAKVRRMSRRSLLSVAAALLLLVCAGFLLLAGDGSTVVGNATDQPMAYTLPDGTDVLLQQGAELTFGPDYNETDRLIDLNGQAYFQVVKNANRPFLVNTAETELRVTGTAFNLRVNDEELEVEVSEGSVELHRAGEVVPVNINQRGLAVLGEPLVVMSVKDLNRHAWRTGVLRFQGTPLGDVIETITSNYGFKVTVPNGCDFPFSGTFSNEDPVSILRTIAAFGQVELELLDENQEGFALRGVCE